MVKRSSKHFVRATSIPNSMNFHAKRLKIINPHLIRKFRFSIWILLRFNANPIPIGLGFINRKLSQQLNWLENEMKELFHRLKRETERGRNSEIKFRSVQNMSVNYLPTKSIWWYFICTAWNCIRPSDRLTSTRSSHIVFCVLYKWFFLCLLCEFAFDICLFYIVVFYAMRLQHPFTTVW